MHTPVSLKLLSSSALLRTPSRQGPCMSQAKLDAFFGQPSKKPRLLHVPPSHAAPDDRELNKDLNADEEALLSNVSRYTIADWGRRAPALTHTD